MIEMGFNSKFICISYTYDIDQFSTYIFYIIYIQYSYSFIYVFSSHSMHTLIRYIH